MALDYPRLGFVYPFHRCLAVQGFDQGPLPVPGPWRRPAGGAAAAVAGGPVDLRPPGLHHRFGVAKFRALFSRDSGSDPRVEPELGGP